MQPLKLFDELEPNEDRRRFLTRCGKLNRAVPPTTTLLTSTSLNYSAIASSADGAGKTAE